VTKLRGGIEVTQGVRADYCIAGAGPAGLILATKLAASGKNVLLIDQAPRYTGVDRAAMLRRGVESLNDYADYNDEASPNAVTPHSSAGQGVGVAGNDDNPYASPRSEPFPMPAHAF
jgi:NADPH-dependent 2,4-dienoyl-CoA reductase/sulfur reductase-like enzyme